MKDKSTWRTTMPRHFPPKEQAQVVVSIRYHDGTRVELVSELPREQANVLMRSALRAHQEATA